MKTFILCCILILLTGCRTRIDWDYIYLKTPSKISALVRNNIHIISQTNDINNINTGVKIWERKEGDCDDVSIIIHELCNRAGIPSIVLVLHNIKNNMAHAYVFGSYNDECWMSDNACYKRTKSFAHSLYYEAEKLRWKPKDISIYYIKKIDKKYQLTPYDKNYNIYNLMNNISEENFNE